jgi:hypothetical protein
MRTEEAAHAYTTTWCKDGKIDFVTLTVALGSGTCVSVSALRWS